MGVGIKLLETVAIMFWRMDGKAGSLMKGEKVMPLLRSRSLQGNAVAAIDQRAEEMLDEMIAGTDNAIARKEQAEAHTDAMLDESREAVLAQS